MSKVNTRHMKKLVEGVAESDQREGFVIAQQKIREASRNHDFDTAMNNYRSIRLKRYIAEPAVADLTKMMSRWAGLQVSLPEGEKADRDTRDKVHDYVLQLEKDVRESNLTPSSMVSQNLLDYYTTVQSWDLANQFWKWLEAQEDTRHVSSQVYGQAIQLLAAQDTSLEAMEALYEKGLARFPENFAPYHLSTGGIVPDRERIFRNPLPLALMGSIMQARAMRGDSQNAYLALDTLLRLRPVALEKVNFQLFLRERPISEAYTVFAMACKAGVVLPKPAYRRLITSLRANADLNDPARYASAVKAMLSATYLYIGAGGQLVGNAVTELVIVLTGMLRIKGCHALAEPQKIQLVDAVQELVNKVIAISARFDAAPTIAAFNSILTNVGGLAKVEEVATNALKEAHVIGLQATKVTRRSLLAAAGSAKNAELVAEAWKWLVEGCAKEDEYPDATDLHILITACIRSNIGKLARAAIDEMSHLEPSQIENAVERLEKELDMPAEPETPADADAMLAALADIKADLEVFDERTSDARGVQDFSSYTPPMLLFTPPKEVQLPEAEMRMLYDELTTVPAAPKSNAPAENAAENAPAEAKKSNPDVSIATNVPVGQLRYESWKYITYLISEAERHDKAYADAVDSAIAKGEKPPQRSYGELFWGDGKTIGVGLSDPPQQIPAVGEEVDVEKVRARIMELRKVPVPKAQE